MRNLISVLLIALPFASNAQYWRVQASGGIATLGILGGAQQVHIGVRVPGGYYYPSYVSGHIPDGKTVFPAFGLALMRRVGNFEIGLQAETTSPRRVDKGSIERTSTSGTTTHTPYRITGHVGRPVVPMTAFYNYYPGPKKGNGFVGLHAGIAYAAGRDQADFDLMPAVQVVDIYYHDAWGFTGGVQLGYRKEIGPMDLGFMLQLKYMHFNLKHGTEEKSYRTQLLVLPAQLYAGYRFGHKTKPAMKSETALD